MCYRKPSGSRGGRAAASQNVRWKIHHSIRECDHAGERQPGVQFVRDGSAKSIQRRPDQRNIDYNVSEKNRLAAKYYFQNDPTKIPFAVSGVNGFPQTMQAGSQLFSLDNTTVLSPNATWENRYGFIRMIANATTAQSLTP